MAMLVLGLGVALALALTLGSVVATVGFEAAGHDVDDARPGSGDGAAANGSAAALAWNGIRHWTGVPDFCFHASGASAAIANGVFTPVAERDNSLEYVNAAGVILQRYERAGVWGWAMTVVEDDDNPLYGVMSDNLMPPVGLPGDTGWTGGWRPGTDVAPTLVVVAGDEANVAFAAAGAAGARRALAAARLEAYYARLQGDPAERLIADAWHRQPPPRAQSFAAWDLARGAASASAGRDERGRGVHGASAGSVEVSEVVIGADASATTTVPPQRFPRAPKLLHTLPKLQSTRELPALAQRPIPQHGSGSDRDRRANLAAVPASDVSFFRRHGWVRLHGLLSEQEVSAYRPHIHVASQRSVSDLYKSSASKDFARVHNLWRVSDAARQLALSPRLGSVAAALLGVPHVRLYQCSSFLKEPGDHESSWHVDQVAAPLHTDLFVTVWLALVDMTPDMGPLVFGDGSHTLEPRFVMNVGPAWVDQQPFNVTTPAQMFAGDTTWHTGRTLHAAPSNAGAWTREAYAVSYFADGATVYGAADAGTLADDDVATLQLWDDIVPGMVVRGPHVPLAGAAPSGRR